jgi:hypothetical protein
MTLKNYLKKPIESCQQLTDWIYGWTPFVRLKSARESVICQRLLKICALIIPKKYLSKCIKQEIKMPPVTIDKLPHRYYEEIISILAKNGRRDLIKVLKYYRDDDYKPKTHNFDETSDSSGEEEVYDSDDVSVDSDGLLSLKEQ